MGWLRTLFLGEIGNRLDIADAERHIGDLRIRQSRQRRADATGASRRWNRRCRRSSSGSPR
jgi:hypothetical protein